MPNNVVEVADSLWEDPTWQEVLRELGTIFGTTRTDGQIRSSFGHYVVPAGTGVVVSAGHGKKVPAGRERGHVSPRVSRTDTRRVASVVGHRGPAEGIGP